jgi:serine/threonine protein kinase
MDGPDSTLWFKINEDKGGEVVYFKRRNGRLWKLGDGTYGVVYVVHSDLRGNDFAVKLLYDNEATIPRQLTRLPREAVSAIANRVVEEQQWPPDHAAKLLEILLRTYKNPDGLTLALARTDLPGWESVLEGIRKRANSAAVERFNRESRVSSIIRDDQLRRALNAQVSGTVDIIGSTQRFRSYPAYEHLKSEFDELGVAVSDFALVMDKYQFSMKDLLERGPGEAYWIAPSVLEEVFAKEPVPEAIAAITATKPELERLAEEQTALRHEQRLRLHEAIEAPPAGYELLKRMTFEDRIRTALPFLRDIVVGLSRLHRVSYKNGGPLFHLDIKPANIYIKHDDAKGIVCALGDLGFLPLEPEHDRTMDTSLDDLPLGTLHFRSPEQKEHFDVANVEMNVRGNDVFLDIRDPKFSGSFIEKGDSVIFSRDGARIRHIIEHIIPSTPTTPIRVQIAARPDQSKDGEQTQVIFLKRQEYRTDLFGVGAIAFDLISCGRSSERFYESIRRFEFDGTGRGSVESTIGKYRRVKDGLADEPELIHIFEPFRRGSDYAPEAFVELILRCMLYKADKTFYAPYEAKRPTAEQINASEFFEDPRSKAITNALTYIDHELDFKNNAFTLNNPLITLKPPPPPATKADRLETIINRLQEPNYDWKLRLAQGAYFYEKLAALVQDRTKAADHPFLYQMLPAGIRYLPQNELSPFQFAYSAYISQRDYENDLVVGDMDKMLKTVTHPFVPNQVAFARREVMLTKMAEHGSKTTPKGERCALRFLDAASYTKTQARDWIVYRTLDDERHLWQIVETLETLGRDHIVVSPVGPSARPLFGPGANGQIEALHYSRLVPAKYYLDVLGLYLLNLLVANSSCTTNSREKINVDDLGDRIDLAQQDQGIWEGISSLVAKPKRIFEGNNKNGLQDIFDFIAQVYVKLAWHDSSSSYYGKAAAGRETDVEPSAFLLDVVNDAKTLRNRVEDFLSVPRNTFESEQPTTRRLQNVGEHAERDFAALVAKPLDIRQLMIHARRGRLSYT